MIVRSMTFYRFLMKKRRDIHQKLVTPQQWSMNSTSHLSFSSSKSSSNGSPPTPSWKMNSQYHKEAEKCDSGMDSCEAAREKAEKVVGEQRKLPAIWELRAREREWREGINRSQVNQNFE